MVGFGPLLQLLTMTLSLWSVLFLDDTHLFFIWNVWIGQGGGIGWEHAFVFCFGWYPCLLVSRLRNRQSPIGQDHTFWYLIMDMSHGCLCNQALGVESCFIKLVVLGWVDKILAIWIMMDDFSQSFNIFVRLFLRHTSNSHMGHGCRLKFKREG